MQDYNSVPKAPNKTLVFVQKLENFVTNTLEFGTIYF